MQAVLSKIEACLPKSMPSSSTAAIIEQVKQHASKIIAEQNHGSTPTADPIRGCLVPVVSLCGLVDRANVPNISRQFDADTQKQLVKGYIAFARQCVAAQSGMCKNDYRVMIIAKFVFADLIGYND